MVAGCEKKVWKTSLEVTFKAAAEGQFTSVPNTNICQEQINFEMLEIMMNLSGFVPNAKMGEWEIGLQHHRC